MSPHTRLPADSLRTTTKHRQTKHFIRVIVRFVRTCAVAPDKLAPFSQMSLTIRDLETERLADEVAELTRDSKTGAVRQALRAERDRLRRDERPRRGYSSGFSLREVWLLALALELGPHRADRGDRL
jgi:antitoxin VapB